MKPVMHSWVALTTVDTAPATTPANPYTAFVTPTDGTFTFYRAGSATAVVPLNGGVIHHIKFDAVKTTGSSVTANLIGGWLGEAEVT